MSSPKKSHATHRNDSPKDTKTNEVETVLRDDPKDEKKESSPNKTIRKSPRINKTSSFDEVIATQVDRSISSDVILNFSQNSPKNIGSVLSPKVVEETEEFCSESIERKSPGKSNRINNVSVYSNVKSSSQVEGVNLQSLEKGNYCKNSFKKRDPKFSPEKKDRNEQANLDEIERQSLDNDFSNDIFKTAVETVTCVSSAGSSSQKPLIEEEVESSKIVEISKESDAGNIESAEISFDKLKENLQECYYQNLNKNKEESPKIIKETEELQSHNMEAKSPRKVRRNDDISVNFDYINSPQKNQVRRSKPSSRDLKLSPEKSDEFGKKSRISPDKLSSIDKTICASSAKHYLRYCIKDKEKLLSSKIIEKNVFNVENTDRRSEESFLKFNDNRVESDIIDDIAASDCQDSLQSRKIAPKAVEETEELCSEIIKDNSPGKIKEIEVGETDQDVQEGNGSQIPRKKTDLSLSSIKSPCFCGYESSDNNSTKTSESRKRKKKSRAMSKRLSLSLKDSVEVGMKDPIEGNVIEKSPLTKIKDFFFSSHEEENTCLINKINHNKKSWISPNEKRQCNTDEESPTAYVSESNSRRRVKKLKYSENDNLNKNGKVEVGENLNQRSSTTHDSSNLDKNGFSGTIEQQREKRSKEGLSKVSCNHNWNERDEEENKCDTNIDEDKYKGNKKFREHKKNAKSGNGDIEMENDGSQYCLDAGASTHGGTDEEEWINSKTNETGVEVDHSQHSFSTNVDRNEKELINSGKRKRKKKEKPSNDEAEKQVNQFIWTVDVAPTVDRVEERIDGMEKRKHKKKEKLENKTENQYCSAVDVSAHSGSKEEDRRKAQATRKPEKDGNSFDDARIETEGDYPNILPVNASAKSDLDEIELMVSKKRRKHERKDKLNNDEGNDADEDNQCGLTISASKNVDHDNEKQINLKKRRKKIEDFFHRERIEVGQEDPSILNVSAFANVFVEKELVPRNKKKLKKKEKSVQNEVVEAEENESQLDVSASPNAEEDLTNLKEKKKHKKKKKLYEDDNWYSLAARDFSTDCFNHENIVKRKRKRKQKNKDTLYNDHGLEAENEENKCSSNDDGNGIRHKEEWLTLKNKPEKKDLSKYEENEADESMTIDRNDERINRKKLSSNGSEADKLSSTDPDEVLVGRNKSGSSNDEESEPDGTIVDHNEILMSEEQSRSRVEEECETGDVTHADLDEFSISEEKSKPSNDEDCEADEDTCDSASSDNVNANNEKKEVVISLKGKLSNGEENRELDNSDGTSSDATEHNYKRIVSGEHSKRLPSSKILSKQNVSSGESDGESSDSGPVEDSKDVTPFIKEVDIVDFLDDTYGLNLSKMSETVAEVLQNKERVMNKLKNLKINLDWEVPKQLRKKSLAQTDLPKCNKHFLKGRFTEEETQYLLEAWQEFCETYNLDPSDFSALTPDPVSKRKKLRNEKKLKFVLYLSKYLQGRVPAAVYRKFVRMGGRKWKFTAEEDQFLIEMYKTYNGRDISAVCALLLNRHRNNIYKRFVKLKRDGLIDEKSRMEIDGDELEHSDLRNRILQSLVRRKGNDLKTTYMGTFASVGREFFISPAKVKLIFFAELYPQLFADRPLGFYAYIIELLARLKKEKRPTWEGLPWTSIARHCHHTAPIFLYTFLRQLVIKHVPSHLWTNLHQCIKYLDRNIVPTYIEKEKNGEEHWYLRQIDIVE